MKLVIDWPDILNISHSRLKTWRRCQMQHHYRYYQGLRKKVDGLPLFVGKGIHSMIEAQVTTGDWSPQMADFRKEFGKLMAEEREELGDMPGDIEGIMKEYFRTYQDDGLTYIPRHRGATAEIKVSVDLDNHTRFIGFIDKFPQDQEGRNWVMDHKSCKSIPDETSRFADLQLLMYVWLLPQLGYPRPDGVIWDYLKKKPPSVPERLKSGEFSRAAKIDTTYSVYMKTVTEALGAEKAQAYEEFASTLKGRETKFLRRIYLPSPSPVMVENVVKDVLYNAKEIRNLGPNAQTRNMTRDCGWCSYYNLCQAEVRGMDSEFIRKADYIVKEKVNDTEENIESLAGSDE